MGLAVKPLDAWGMDEIGSVGAGKRVSGVLGYPYIPKYT